MRKYEIVLDEIGFWINRKVAAIANKYLKWTKYDTAKAELFAGTLALGTYTALVAKWLLNDPENINTPGKLITCAGALIMDIYYAWGMYQDHKKLKVAPALEEALLAEHFDNVPAFETRLQRYKSIPEAKWYAASILIWPVLFTLYHVNSTVS